MNSVQTKFIFDSTPEAVWNELVFYENINRRQPFLLRLLLPIPIRNEGHISKKVDETLCLYDGGHLLKRLTQIKKCELYEFEIIEQKLSIKLGIRLIGGCYSLVELPNGKTEISAETNYGSIKSPRWLWEPIERTVCHWFHHYLLNSIRKKIKSK